MTDVARSAHGDRCRSLRGWAPVEWTAEQTDEFVSRFEAYRRKRASENANPPRKANHE